MLLKYAIPMCSFIHRRMVSEKLLLIREPYWLQDQDDSGTNLENLSGGKMFCEHKMLYQ